MDARLKPSIETAVAVENDIADAAMATLMHFVERTSAAPNASAVLTASAAGTGGCGAGAAAAAAVGTAGADDTGAADSGSGRFTDAGVAV